MSLIVRQEVLAGLVIVGLGCFFLWFGLDYSFGTARRMGPGYFPVILSVGLIAMGLVMALRGAIKPGPPFQVGRLRPPVAILGSIVLFALTISSVGFLPAAFLGVMVGALATREFRWLEMTLFALCSTAAAALLFVHLLGLPMRLLAG